MESDGLSAIDRSIRPLVLTLHRLGVRTLFSCSGLLSDHREDEEGMATPYLALSPAVSDPVIYRAVRQSLIASGFVSRDHIEYLRRDFMPIYYDADAADLTQRDRWYGEDRNRHSVFNFFFGVDTSKHDIEYSRLIEPLWQERIRTAWLELYRRTLRLLLYRA